MLLNKVIYHINSHNILNLPLLLTSKGIKASHYLMNIINILGENNYSPFKGDNILFVFLSDQFSKLFRLNMQLSLKTIKPNIMYDLPLGHNKVIDRDCSGIYCFVHKTGKFGIGSAISFPSRVNGYMNSFYGHCLRSHLHDWVMGNGDLSSIKWAPIISYDNIIQ